MASQDGPLLLSGNLNIPAGTNLQVQLKNGSTGVCVAPYAGLFFSFTTTSSPPPGYAFTFTFTWYYDSNFSIIAGSKQITLLGGQYVGIIPNQGPFLTVSTSAAGGTSYTGTVSLYPTNRTNQSSNNFIPNPLLISTVPPALNAGVPQFYSPVFSYHGNVGVLWQPAAGVTNDIKLYQSQPTTTGFAGALIGEILNPGYPAAPTTATVGEFPTPDTGWFIGLTAEGGAMAAGGSITCYAI